ncbi:MAG: GHKL domain-containing protein, partial [Butyrivibrio sp.]|nr:GHKL domain-containing protein [Butyrivibrio sp.]
AACMAAAAAVLGADWAYITMFLAVLVTLLVLANKRGYALLRIIPAFLIYFTLTNIPSAMIENMFANVNKNIVIGDYAQSLLSVEVDAVLLSLLVVLCGLVKKYRITVYFRTREILGSVALFFFAFTVGQLMALANRQPHAPAMHYVYVAVFGGAYIFGAAYYFYSVAETWRRVYRQTEISAETEYMKLKLAALQDTKENEEQTRRMSHDLNKHLALMKTLCDEGKFDDVYKYINQLGVKNIKSDIIPTGNGIADLVVGQKRKLCEERGIEFTFEGMLNGMGNMKESDVCGLLANAYDNAIEACASQSGAYVRTRVNSTRNYTVIEIANPVEKKVSVRKNGVPTSKRDKRAHGYGIEIMKQIARRYKGSCTLSCDDKEFRVKIVLLT